MSNLIQTSAIESALIQGDLSKLTSEQRLSYYKSVCESVGLNPLTKPFEYINLNGKLTLYAKRDATDQLRKVSKVSITISSREKFDDIFVVTAKARDKEGREDESTGSVNVAGLKGDALANAFMKAETKAKRRVTLSICGLGLLDESEVETIKDAKPFDENMAHIENKKDEVNLTEQGISSNPGEHQVTFGKYKGQKLKDVDMYELDNYIKWVIDSAKSKGKEITGNVKEFVDNAEAYLTSIEVVK
jgi:hypothetical protein